jgi:signal transduction histidine kinase
MAREIHDTLSQGLTGAVLQIDAAGEILEESPEKARAFLARARQLARSSLGEARRSIWALRSEALEAHDLPRALSEMAGQMAAGRNVAIEVAVSGDLGKLPSELEGELFRIAQEAVANAFRYAEATRIRLEVGREREDAFLVVSDDGQGFDPDRVTPAAGGGFGLPGMRERAERLSGRVEVSSAPGRGTRVEARFPLPPR